jgi:hypothetical protein
MSNADLIAEAREAQSVAFNDYEVGYALIIRALADALEAQPAPLVANSREALARGIEAVDYYGLSIESKISERSYATADFLLASGVVSLAGDRDRATAKRAWDEGMKAALLEDGGDVGPVNPYREGEARND